MQKINKLFICVLLFGIINTFIATSLTDTNPSNNIKSITVNVVETKKLNLTFIPIDNPNNFDSNVEEFVKFFNLTYPVSDDGLLATKGQFYTSSPEEKDNLRLLLFHIARFGLLGNIKRTVGVVPRDWFRDFTSFPNSSGYAINPFIITVYPSALAEAREMRQIAAHEIGHTFGLCDEHSSGFWSSQNTQLITNRTDQCPNADTDNNEILDTNCELQGCPTSTLGELVPWNNSNDFINMTNLMGSNDQDKTWISNESYVHLLSKFQTSPIIAQTALLVNGIINKTNGSIQLFTSYIIQNAEITQQATNVSGNYSIEIINNNSLVTSVINFTPSFLDIGFNGSTVETNVSFFIIVMNFSSSDKGVIAKENKVIKDEVNRTPNTPNITITFPIGNEVFDKSINLTWNASDLDNDTIQYAVLISSDNGNTFSTLKIDHPNTSITINSTNFDNSNQYKIKILATDGINTGNDTSETFSIYHDINKFLIKNASGNNIAWFGDAGNVVIKGNLEQNSNFQATDNFAFKIRNNLNDVLIIENNGSMYIDGTLAENQGTLTSDTNKNDFRVKDNSSNLVININETGYVLLKGTLTQNGNP